MGGEKAAWDIHIFLGGFRMRTNRAFSSRLITFIAACGALIASAPPEACTRALYVAKDGTVIVGRSMDWGEDMMSNMWVLPRGMKRDGRGGKNTISWISKYGSLIVTGRQSNFTQYLAAVRFGQSRQRR